MKGRHNHYQRCPGVEVFIKRRGITPRIKRAVNQNGVLHLELHQPAPESFIQQLMTASGKGHVWIGNQPVTIIRAEVSATDPNRVVVQLDGSGVPRGALELFRQRLGVEIPPPAYTT